MEELLWKCVGDDLRGEFEQYPKGVQVDEFVSLVYASLCTTYEDSPHLWEDDKDIKSQLFRLFKKIDVDGNRVLTWEEFTTFLIDEAIAKDQPNQPRPYYIHSRTIWYSKSANYNPLACKPRVETQGQKQQTTQRLLEKYGELTPVERNPAPSETETCPDEVIRKMFFYPKWDKIVTCGRFKECHVVNPADFSKICTVDARPGAVIAAEYIPDTHCLAVTRNDSRMQFFAIREKSNPTSLELEDLYIMPLAEPNMVVKWHDKYKRLYTGDKAGTVFEWDAGIEDYLMKDSQETDSFTTGFGPPVGSKGWQATQFEKFRSAQQRMVRKWSRHTEPILDMIFLPKGQMVTGSMDTTITVHDLGENDHSHYTLQGHKAGVCSLTYSSEYQLLLSSGFEYNAYCWNVNVPHDKPTLLHDPIKPHNGTIVKIHAIDGTSQVLSCDSKGKIKIWDLRTMKSLTTIFIEKGMTKAEQEVFHISDLLHLPSKAELVVSGKHVYFFQGNETQKFSQTSDQPVTIALYNRAFNKILTASGRNVTIWDARTGNEVTVFKDLTDSLITAMVLTPKGRHFWVGTSSGKLSMFKFQFSAGGCLFSTGECILPLGQVHAAEITAILYCQRDAISRADMIISVSRDGTVCVVGKDQRTPTKQFSLHPKKHAVTCAAHSSALGLVAFGTTAGVAYVFDVHSMTTRGVLQKVAVEFGELVSAVFLDPYPVMALSDSEGGVSLWTVRPQDNLMLVRFMNSRASTGAHHPTVLAMSWSNALHCLYTADEMGRVGVWRMVDLLKKANMKPVLNSAETPIKAMRSTVALTQLSPNLVHQDDLWLVHSDECKCIQLLPELHVVLTAGYDRKVHLTNADGDHLGTLIQGRDTTSAAQYPGALEPYSFPMAPGPTQGEQERWRNVEKWIWLFYKKLRACTGENRKPVDQGTVVKRKQSTMPARKPSGADVVLQAQDSKARLAAEDRQEEVARKAEELQKAEAVRADRTPAQPRALFTLPTAATEVTSRRCAEGMVLPTNEKTSAIRSSLVRPEIHELFRSIKEKSEADKLTEWSDAESPQGVPSEGSTQSPDELRHFNSEPALWHGSADVPLRHGHSEPSLRQLTGDAELFHGDDEVEVQHGTHRHERHLSNGRTVTPELHLPLPLDMLRPASESSSPEGHADMLHPTPYKWADDQDPSWELGTGRTSRAQPPTCRLAHPDTPLPNALYNVVPVSYPTSARSTSSCGLTASPLPTSRGFTSYTPTWQEQQPQTAQPSPRVRPSTAPATQSSPRNVGRFAAGPPQHSPRGRAQRPRPRSAVIASPQLSTASPHSITREHSTASQGSAPGLGMRFVQTPRSASREPREGVDFTGLPPGVKPFSEVSAQTRRPESLYEHQPGQMVFQPPQSVRTPPFQMECSPRQAGQYLKQHRSQALKDNIAIIQTTVEEDRKVKAVRSESITAAVPGEAGAALTPEPPPPRRILQGPAGFTIWSNGQRTRQPLPDAGAESPTSGTEPSAAPEHLESGTSRPEPAGPPALEGSLPPSDLRPGPASFATHEAALAAKQASVRESTERMVVQPGSSGMPPFASGMPMCSAGVVPPPRPFSAQTGRKRRADMATAAPTIEQLAAQQHRVEHIQSGVVSSAAEAHMPMDDSYRMIGSDTSDPPQPAKMDYKDLCLEGQAMLVKPVPSRALRSDRSVPIAEKQPLRDQAVHLQPFQYFSAKKQNSIHRVKGGPPVGVDRYWVRKGRVKLEAPRHTTVPG